MKLPSLLVAAVFVAATPFLASDGVNRPRPTSDDVHPRKNIGPDSPEPAPTPVMTGDFAPDFSYQRFDNQWCHLHDLLAQGSVFLVFGGDESQLRALERERTRLLDEGVLPVAVLDRRSGATWSIARHLGLGYNVLSDPQSVIASQFNVLDPNTRHPMPSWFVVDRTGRVRGLRRDALPASGFFGLAATSLALPMPGVSLPAGGRSADRP